MTTRQKRLALACMRDLMRWAIASFPYDHQHHQFDQWIWVCRTCRLDTTMRLDGVPVEQLNWKSMAKYQPKMCTHCGAHPVLHYL